jgi:ribonuclease-3
VGIPATPGSVYELALTHRSFAFEAELTEHNERLEFLGDAILGAVVTDLIFRSYPDLTEGEMARLRASVVNTVALAEVARTLELGPHIRLGKGEESSGGRDKASLLADTFEAVVGAAYLDRGQEAVSAFLVPIFTGMLAEVVASGGGHDPKTALQELAVRNRSGRPSYRLASSGPDHDKRFTAEVYVGDRLHGAGSGRSKKEAEQNAAREALARLADAPEGGPRAAGDEGSSGSQNRGTGSAGPQEDRGTGSAGPQEDRGTGSAGPQDKRGAVSARAS